MDFNIVAVTACVSGVAHTYMAAERLEKVGHHEKWNIKIETQGALGVENKITADDIAHADVVLLVTDIEIDEPDASTASAPLRPASKLFCCSRSRLSKRLNAL